MPRGAGGTESPVGIEGRPAAALRPQAYGRTSGSGAVASAAGGAP